MFTNGLVKNSLLLICCGLMLASCDLLQVKKEPVAPEEQEQPVARVNNTYLYASDLEGISESTVNSADSADRAESYINQWVRKQLLIDEAMRRSGGNQSIAALSLGISRQALNKRLQKTRK